MTEDPAPETLRYCPLMSATMPETGVLVRAGSVTCCHPTCAWWMGEACAVAIIAKKLTAG
ncbi:MAG: hypothetical protein HY794_13490 [Desulfarculus sp.]|nr:hypothetical protein [Desulfarculus sp.]